MVWTMAYGFVILDCMFWFDDGLWQAFKKSSRRKNAEIYDYIIKYWILKPEEYRVTI